MDDITFIDLANFWELRGRYFTSDEVCFRS
nr:MAG TPA: ATP-dependent helicase [Caudoviricetes sp.]